MLREKLKGSSKPSTIHSGFCDLQLLQIALWNKYCCSSKKDMVNDIQELTKKIRSSWQPVFWWFEDFISSLKTSFGLYRIMRINRLYFITDWQWNNILEEYPVGNTIEILEGFNPPHFCRKIHRVYLASNIIKRFVNRNVPKYYEWYKVNIIRTGVFLAKYRGKEDVECVVRYHPKYDEFFESAFSGRFKGSLDDKGRVIIYCKKEETTQVAVCIACSPVHETKLLVDAYLNEADTVEQLTERMNAVGKIADKWMLSRLMETCEEYVNDYLTQTLYHLDHTNSLQRIELFTTKNKILAEYIWSVNFSTVEDRQRLAAQLNVSHRNRKAFTSSETVDELEQKMLKKRDNGKTILDDLPPALMTKITREQATLVKAKEGTPVGRFGHYISSNDIDAANHRLREAWKEADQYISRKRLEEAKQKVKLGVK
jgi:hypothetical protein